MFNALRQLNEDVARIYDLMLTPGSRLYIMRVRIKTSEYHKLASRLILDPPVLTQLVRDGDDIVGIIIYNHPVKIDGIEEAIEVSTDG